MFELDLHCPIWRYLYPKTEFNIDFVMFGVFTNVWADCRLTCVDIFWLYTQLLPSPLLKKNGVYEYESIISKLKKKTAYVIFMYML